MNPRYDNDPDYCPRCLVDASYFGPDGECGCEPSGAGETTQDVAAQEPAASPVVAPAPCFPEEEA
jgi:hypothetical protein